MPLGGSAARKRNTMKRFTRVAQLKDADSFNKHEDESSNINNENGDDDLL